MAKPVLLLFGFLLSASICSTAFFDVYVIVRSSFSPSFLSTNWMVIISIILEVISKILVKFSCLFCKIFSSEATIYGKTWIYGNLSESKIWRGSTQCMKKVKTCFPSLSQSRCMSPPSLTHTCLLICSIKFIWFLTSPLLI